MYICIRHNIHINISGSVPPGYRPSGSVISQRETERDGERERDRERQRERERDRKRHREI